MYKLIGIKNRKIKFAAANHSFNHYCSGWGPVHLEGGGELRGGTSVRGNGEGSVVPRDYYLLTISWSLPTEWKKGTIEYWLPINCHWGGGDQVNLIITPPKSSRSPLPFSSPAIKDHRSLSHFQYDYIIFKFKTDCCPGKLKTNLGAFS